jgi:serine/threonine protein kinase
MVIHRDLKSLNIFVDENDRCVVADFGTTKVLDVDKASAQLASAGILTSGARLPL